MDAPERIWAYNAKQTGYRFYANGPQPEFDNVEYVRADLAPARVKPLVWEVTTDQRDGRTHYGHGVFGHWYAVFREKTGAWAVFHFVSGKRTSVRPADSDTYPSLDAAKAAAQADYEGRILAALEPALDLAELVEALRWYGEQSRLARLIHSEGDAGRHTIAADGGKRAAAAIAKIDAGDVLTTRDFEIVRLAREISEISRDLGWHRIYDRAGAIIAKIKEPQT